MAYTPQEREDMRTLAAGIWNQSIADSLDMNDEVIEVISKAAGEALQCSIAFALVPMPMGFPPPKLTLWLLLNLGSILLRLNGVRQHQTFKACIVTAAANWRTPLELASQGI